MTALPRPISCFARGLITVFALGWTLLGNSQKGAQLIYFHDNSLRVNTHSTALPEWPQSPAGP